MFLGYGKSVSDGASPPVLEVPPYESYLETVLPDHLRSTANDLKKMDHAGVEPKNTAVSYSNTVPDETNIATEHEETINLPVPGSTETSLRPAPSPGATNSTNMISLN